MNARRGSVCMRTCVRVYTCARPYYVRTAMVAAAAAAMAVHSCGAPTSVFVARSARSKYPCVRAR